MKKRWGHSINPPETVEVNVDEQNYEEHQDEIDTPRMIPDIE